jgi:hypothetical protein
MICVLAALVAAAPAAAQARRAAPQTPAAPPKYDRPQEITALDTIVQSLARPPDAAPPTPDDLVELSRLLSTPCDQLRWLLSRVQALAAQPEQKALGRQLAQAAARRGQQLAEQGLLSECGELVEQLQALGAAEEPLEKVADPDALRERLGKAEGLTELEPFARFALLSRGAPADRMLARNEAAPWDTPRAVLDRLAGAVELPQFWELLRLQQRLVTAHQSWAGQDTAARGAPEQQQLVEASFQIAAALLDRALGLDAQDMAGVKPPIPYNDSPAAWGALGQTLDGGALWSWATLAHVLAAGPPVGQATRPESITAAREPWEKLRKVNPGVWAAVQDAQSGWLARLGAAERLVTPRMLPLAQGVRAPQHAQRRAAEEKARAVLGGASAATPQGVDELLRNVQLAKAADLGADAAPLGVDDLKRELGGDLPWVYLYIEVLELRETAAAGGGRYCGVALYRTKYESRQAGLAYEDRYDAKAIPLKPTLEDVVRAALASPGPPLVQGQLRKDARVILALDGPPAASWFAFESATLLQPTSWSSTDASWVVYLPSSAALTAPSWTLEETLRAWYRAGLRDGRDLSALAADPRSLTKASCGPPLDRAGLVLYQVPLDAAHASGADRFNDFMAEKRQGALPTIALGVSKGAR